MKKLTPRIIWLFILHKVSHVKFIDNALLKLNDFYNGILKKMIANSYETRALLYGEGGERLSNDPDIHVNWRWPISGSTIWAEVPSFNIQALLKFENRKVLELGCANGWYYREFYSNISNVDYTGCDLSEDTISEAIRKVNLKSKKSKKILNHKFLVADMLEEMPCKNEDMTNIFWFASMCMFTEENRKSIFENISIRLKNERGILSGSGVIKDESDQQWSYYIGLLYSKEALRTELLRFFKNVYITDTSSKNLVFYMASDGELPFYNE